MLLRLPQALNKLSIPQFYVRFGHPEPQLVRRLDGKPNPPGVPSHLVPPVWLGVASHELILPEATLLLADFGVAWRPSDESRSVSQTPLVMRPPEAFFEPEIPLSFASDVWSLGCAIFEILAHRSLIDGFIAPQDEITAQQIHLQGILPHEWWEKWEKRSKWFDQDGKPLSDDCDVWSWERRFEEWVQEPRSDKGMAVLNGDEKRALLELLQRMLSWRPEERPSVQDVLASTWMTEWALPAFEQGERRRRNPG